MVSYNEWMKADDYTVFEHKDTGRKIIKVLLRENLRKVEQYMIKQYANRGEGPTPENVHRIKDLIAATLENFEIVEIKKERQVDQGVEIPEQAAKPIKSKTNNGSFCYKCGLQKENTEIIQKGELAIRLCRECLGV